MTRRSRCNRLPRRLPGRLPRGPRRLLLLYALTAGGALAETAGLKAAGLTSTVPLAAQATTVPALAAFHDARWVFVYADRWWVLAVELVATVAVRSAMGTFLVRAAWPSGRLDRRGLPVCDRPAVGRLLVRMAVAEVLLLAAMSPWALLTFVTAVTSVAYPLLGGIVGAGIIAVLVVPHAGIAERWWTRWPPWRAVAWSALDLMVIVAAAVGIDWSPGWVVLVPAVVAGVLNGWCWQHLVAACALTSSHTRVARPVRLGAVPVSLAAVVVGLAVLMASAVAFVGQQFTVANHYDQAPPHAGQQVVLLVDGYQSRWNGARPVTTFPGFYTAEYSYRGLGAKGVPLPYDSAATTRSLPALASQFAAQVQRLERMSGRPVDVVAVSEGTLVVREYLAYYPAAPVHVAVLLSPLPRPDRVYYPPAGRPGFGFAAAAEIEAILDISRAEISRLDVSTTMPMVRSLVGQGPLFRQRSLCPARGVRVVSLLPMTAAVDDPPGPVGGVPTGVVPALHATLLTHGEVRRNVVAVLRGKPVSRYFGWGFAFQLLRYATTAGESPSLPLSFVPAWRRAGSDRWGDAAAGAYGCPALDHPSTTIAEGH